MAYKYQSIFSIYIYQSILCLQTSHFSQSILSATFSIYKYRSIFTSTYKCWSIPSVYKCLSTSKLDSSHSPDLTTRQQHSASTVHARSVHSHPQSAEPICFFCNKPAGSAGLHEALTYNIDTNVQRCALEIEDTALLAKLAAGDMIAIEAKYHNNCLRSLYNRARQVSPKGSDGDDSCLHGIAFAEL